MRKHEGDKAIRWRHQANPGLDCFVGFIAAQ